MQGRRRAIHSDLCLPHQSLDCIIYCIRDSKASTASTSNMFPPSGGVSHIDLSALSGISGSISIACWVVVFSPQIIENFRRQSAEGLSITFIIIWLLGDIFNILGAVLQGVLPTMLILAVYYTLADIVLLGQCWYYRGFSLWDSDVKGTAGAQDSERAPLLNGSTNGSATHQQNGSTSHSTSHSVLNNLGIPSANSQDQQHRRSSSFSDAIRRDIARVDGTHLSPATPLHDNPKPTSTPTSVSNVKTLSTTQAFLFNTFAVLIVCAAGVLGWFVSSRSTHTHTKTPSDKPSQHPEPLNFDTLGQVFGYLCAVLYLGSRIPQLLLNYRRKSTDGVSLLFFLFACIGNLTYDMSIFAYDPTPSCYQGGSIGKCGPGESSKIYLRYIAVNASWIAGSLGTLFLDLAIFAQFFLYRKDDGDENVAVDSDSDRDIAVQ